MALMIRPWVAAPRQVRLPPQIDDDAHRYVYRPPKDPASDPDMVLTGGGPTKVV
jgi:hypothetical protein